MKIRHLVIQNFKAIKQFEHSFVDELTGQVHPITAIFGDNGSGKTSVLQAIALVVSLATLKTGSLSSFRWPGFLHDRISAGGEEPTYIKIELQVDEDEINAAHESYVLWQKGVLRKIVPKKENEGITLPARETNITLEYAYGHVSIEDDDDGSVGAELLGRYYLNEVAKHTNQNSSLINRVGDVFWFDQYRNLGSKSDRDLHSIDGSFDWEDGIAGLREYLIANWLTHQHSKKRSEDDFIVVLEKKFSTIFSGAKFGGIEVKQSATLSSKFSDWYFLIERNQTTYDISEMSSGEQAVFAIMFDFVARHISRSIVLIDELELHLHPPEQQALYNSLRKIGPDCQFIFTSHSPYLRDIIPPHRMLRLEGGRLCL